jgi:hypothetical protein
MGKNEINNGGIMGEGPYNVDLQVGLTKTFPRPFFSIQTFPNRYDLMIQVSILQSTHYTWTII